ncbi:twin-arginine translocase TatA/TatE family subunit [Mesonia sp. K7]|uniref:twin-arginine translocase TatA/TatE family subunit n=1 Tax=Mesonia sp. K7 TaxID=2218606 RepID=UPI000DA8F623|nr:twin-arginine translocase TatA/TatE family subunit [Mesonia sp. K7]PZD79121.1 twin-arginine translocase TatA/TatE family subunit [Mesonia sp. K7]
MLSNIILAIGAWQIVVIVLIILLLFGGRKIPELMRGLGSGIKEFKDASKDEDVKDSKDANARNQVENKN